MASAYTVLVVDDEPPIRRFLRTSRSAAGYQKVTRSGEPVKLSPKEFELLRNLVAHAGKVLTHRQLLREVWGPAQAEEVQYLRVFIRGLRQKLEADPTRPSHILTELGLGYRLQLPPEQRALIKS